MRNKKWWVIAAMLVLSLVAGACGTKSEGNAPAAAPSESAAPQPSAPASPAPAEPKEMTIKHQLGEAKLMTNPSKVIVFDFGVLDSLDKLGVPVLGLPQKNVPPYLEKYKGAAYENVGSLQEPDFEKINALQPDLIIISGRQSAHYEELNKIAPTIFMGVDTKNYLASFKENMNTLGQIFDKQAAVDEELAKIDSAIEAVKAKTADGKTGLVVLTTGGKISAFGPGSRFGIIHDVLGVTPADSSIDVSTHGMSVTLEFIAEKNPDYLFVVDRDAVVSSNAEAGASAKQIIENELVKNTKAYQNGKIIYLDPSYWYLSGGGLVSVASMIEEVQNGLN